MENHNYWRNKRVEYNKYLILACIITGIIYLVLAALFSERLEIEVTVFTLAFQFFGLVVFVSLANLFYSLGAYCSNIFAFNARKLYTCGLIFSLLIVAVVPVVLISRLIFSFMVVDH